MEHTTEKNLVRLADAFAEHTKLSIWRVGFLAVNDGKFFGRISGRHDPSGKGARTCRPPTAAAVVWWFLENWPDDLGWPDLVWEDEIAWSPAHQEAFKERFKNG